MRIYFKVFLSIIIFLISFFLIGQNLNKPFWGEHDWNGVRYGNIARNFLRYGFLETKFGQVENSGRVGGGEFEYYTHYPPLLTILIALSYKIFGISEWSTRLAPLSATSASLVVIFLIGSKLWNLKVGILAAVLALVTPMVLYFGKNPVYDPLALFFILFSFHGYQLYLENKKLFSKILFIIGLILAEVTAWAGFFLIPAITITSLLRRDFISVKKMIPLWFLSVFIFLIYLGHVYLLTGSIFGGDLFRSFVQRSGISSNLQPEGFTILGYLNRLRLWFSTLFTITLIFSSFIWLVGKKVTGVQDKDWMILTLGIIGIIYLIIFSNAVFIHNYLVIYFLPFLALSAALGIDIFIKLFKLSRIYPLVVVFFVLTVFLERRNFLLVLNESAEDQLSVKIGKAINQNTNTLDTIFISPLKFSYSADKFLRFYSDRKIGYSDYNQMKYDVKVLVDTDNQKFEIIKK